MFDIGVTTAYNLSHPMGTRLASISGFVSAIRRCLMALICFLTAARNRFILIACAVTIATIYVLVTFDRSFLLGIGPFWANPIGPWLMELSRHDEQC